MIDKEHAKAVAEKEVLARVNTLEQAKEKYKAWIKSNLVEWDRFLDTEKVEFWEEVYAQVDKITDIPNESNTTTR